MSSGGALKKVTSAKNAFVTLFWERKKVISAKIASVTYFWRGKKRMNAKIAFVTLFGKDKMYTSGKFSLMHFYFENFERIKDSADRSIASHPSPRRSQSRAYSSRMPLPCNTLKAPASLPQPIRTPLL